MESKEFSIEAALMLATGKSFGAFGEFHQLAEWVMGHPIWSHEFAEKALWVRMRAAAIAQHPQLAEANGEIVTCENAIDWLAEHKLRFGNTLAFTKGTGERTEHPIESIQRLAPGKPVIAVEVQ